MHFGSLDLNLLVVFRALMLHRNTTKAAEDLRLTQPAVSHALRRLRDHYQDPLFVRQLNRMEPTSRALALAGPIQDALDLIAATERNMRFDAKSLRRTFRIGLVNFGALYLFPALLQKFAAEAPFSQVVCEHLGCDAAYKLLEEGGIDCAIGLMPEQPFRNRRFLLFNEAFVVVSRIGHPVVCQTISAADFAKVGHVRIPMLDGLDAILASEGVVRRFDVTAQDLLSVPFIVARSDLVAIVPRSFAAIFSSFCHLQELGPPAELPPYLIELVFNRRHETDPAHRWMVDCIRDLAVEISCNLEVGRTDGSVGVPASAA